MLGLAGVAMGYSFRFLDPSPSACAAAVGDVVVGALDDPDALDRTAAGAALVTYEWEGVPAASVRRLAAGAPAYPPIRALAVSQDRVAEKMLCRELEIATAPFAAVDDHAGLLRAADEIGFPAILKTRGGGYDGKGQVPIATPADLDPAWAEMSAAGPLVDAAGPLIYEGRVAFDRELSVLACRGRDGAVVTWPVVENEHEHGILRASRVRSGDPDVQAAATDLAARLLVALDYVGVLCVELFAVGSDLLVNEFAPRVHNSGHWTIEGAQTSQFENHLRAGLGLPLGDASARGPAAMVNCIGVLPATAAVLAIAGTHFHDYGKSPRRGRKLGHVTVVADDDETLDRRLAAVRALVVDDG